jgi:hypothetical protein
MTTPMISVTPPNPAAGPQNVITIESVTRCALTLAERLRAAEDAAVAELAALSADNEHALVRALGSIYAGPQERSTTAAGAAAAELLHSAIIASRARP